MYQKNYVHLNLYGGREVFININHITHVKDSDPRLCSSIGCIVYVQHPADYTLKVKESYSEVLDLIASAT